MRMTSLGVACFSQTSWLVDKKQITCFVTAFSFVFLVWLVGCGFGGIFEVFEIRDFPGDQFHQLPYPGSSFQWVDSDTLFSFVWFLPPVKSCSVTYILFWRVVMWQLIITVNNTAIRQGSLMLHALWALEIQKWMSESLSLEVCYLLKLWVLLQKCQKPDAGIITVTTVAFVRASLVVQ